MSILKFCGTVRLRPSILGVVVLGWREGSGRYKPFNGKSVPYHLASFLRLMPKDGEWLTFSNVLYGFSVKDLNELQADSDCILRVTRSHGHVTVTIQTP